MQRSNMNSLQKYRYSFIAGACAAGGSFFGKLPSYLAARKSWLLLPAMEVGMEYYIDLILLRALPIGLMIVCNVLNWRYFLKALQTAEQTLTATVLTAASNYMMSFILAAVIYQEPFTVLSAIGSTLIVAGLWFLCDTHREDVATEQKKIS